MSQAGQDWALLDIEPRLTSLTKRENRDKPWIRFTWSKTPRSNRVLVVVVVVIVGVSFNRIPGHSMKPFVK